MYGWGLGNSGRLMDNALSGRAPPHGNDTCFDNRHRSMTGPTRKVYSSPLLSLAVVGGFGLLLFLFSAGKTLLDFFYRTQGREIVATVTWCGYTSSANSRSVRYTFTLPDGRSFRGSQTGYGGTVGEPILVAYLPSNPSFNRVAGAERQGKKWLPFLAIAGLFFMFAGARSYNVLRRQA